MPLDYKIFCNYGSSLFNLFAYILASIYLFIFIVLSRSYPLFLMSSMEL